jgi:hypothetical protein
MTKQTLNADVDLFLYGLSETEARTKIKTIFEMLKATGPATGKSAALALRTPNTVSEACVAERRPDSRHSYCMSGDGCAAKTEAPHADHPEPSRIG